MEFFLSTFWPKTAQFRPQIGQKACPGSEHVKEGKSWTKSNSLQGVKKACQALQIQD